MKHEFEVKILEVNAPQAVEKLQGSGGKIVFGPGLVKTAFFDHPKLKLREQGIPLRVRAMGDKAYLNIKHAGPQGGEKIKQLEEFEVLVEDFAKMCELLGVAGYYPFRYQEKKRTTFQFPGARVELEQYPASSPYLEFEGQTLEATQKLVEQLGYTLNQTVKLSATEVLKKGGVANPDMVRFDDSEPLPDYLRLKKVDTIAEADKKFEEVLWEKD